MGYYDNVKENVKKESQDGSSGSSSGGGNFDTLKEAATETDPDEDGDDTPIEVLEEDGLDRNRQKKQSESSSPSRNQGSSGSKNNSGSSGNPLKSGQDSSNSSNSGSGSSGSVSDADLSRIEEKMDTIIDQNQEMIEILRSFAE